MIGAREPVSTRSCPRLSWADSAGSHVLDLGDSCTVGSVPGCGMVVLDRAVSRVHADVTPREDGLWVRDLGSRNGTFVAGVKVNEARLPAGSTVRFGTTDITVSYEPTGLPRPLWPEPSFSDLFGASTSMREVFALVARLATTDSAVLFVGEAGTGKSALARAMHDASARAMSPFVVIDCAALPEPVEAAELFEEALRNAEGGTLYLDEPAELPLAIQRELIPPLDAKVFRVVATSQQDLRPLVNQGAFREGLYFRLSEGATINVPPLRERREDLPRLLEHFLGEDAALATPALLEDLARAPWMGNVRELARYATRLRGAHGDVRGFLRPAEAMEGGSENFDPEELPTMEAPILDVLERGALGEMSGDPSRALVGLEAWFETGFKEFRERWIELGEREYLRRLMKRTDRSSSAASREAGLERTYLYRLLKKHGV